jgi:hypothetical protein
MAYRLPTSQYGRSVLDEPISVEVGRVRVGERRDLVRLEYAILEAASEIGVNWMRYILVLPVPRLPARHGDEYATLALYDLDIMHDKAVVEGHRHVRLELALRRDPSDADIRDLHGCESPCRRA